MIREIVSRSTFKHHSCPRNARGSTTVTLSCGHQKIYKASQAPERHAHCNECDRGPAVCLDLSRIPYARRPHERGGKA